ncbi:ATP-binding protein [Desulfosarcina sp.]|uniref:ATP-binding protein n=1 Tax=Desulfosarcina sp. TaxID=2027861 RepID=UPI00397103EE
MDKDKFRIFLSGFSPWIILGAVLVMLPLVAWMTLETINRQKQQRIRLMMEKGAALIRSFEAGTRMGMRGGHGSGFQLQRLLIETAAQPDIAHLLVVDIDGTVIAHNQMDRLGSRYGTDLDLEFIYRATAPAWRRTVVPDGEAVFEVFGKFAPMAKRPNRPMHGDMMRMGDMSSPDREVAPMVIFVGFRTDAVDAAHAADARHTVVMAVVLLLVGCAGVLLLFLAQNYRSTRVSLAREKAFSDNLVSRMPIGLVALDRDDRVTALNSVAEATLGIRAAGVIGTTARAVIPAILADSLTDDRRLVEKEVLCPLADGRLIPMDVSAATLTDENGESFGQVILFKDLTELRALHQELERNRRLALVGRLAAGVAHEIRNPLSSIKGFATYFKEKYRDSDRDQEIAGIMIQEVDRLNRVVGQLLEFSRPIRLHFQEVALKPFFQDSFRLVDRQSRQAGVSMALDMADERICAVMDADKMNQVMLNLLLNALDAMTAGGRLTVRVSSDGNGSVVIQVIDTGTGIDPRDQFHIFEPYFSTKKTGTGLGLAIVHNIVKAHQGDIVVASQTGAGTTVEITLPAVQEV